MLQRSGFLFYLSLHKASVAKSHAEELSTIKRLGDCDEIVLAEAVHSNGNIGKLKTEDATRNETSEAVPVGR